MKLGILNYFDLFRLPVSLYYEGYTKRASWIGLFFSFGIYTFILYSFFQSDIFQKKSPSVVYQSNKIQFSKKIQFNDKVLIAVSVGDVSSRRYMDESIFTLQFKYFTNMTNAIYKTLLPCTLMDVDFNHSLYQNLGLAGSYCLQNKTFSYFQFSRVYG